MGKLFVLLLIALILKISDAGAQTPSTVAPPALETVRGRVVEITRLPSTKDSTGGFEILLNSKAGPYRVLLEPKLQKGFAKQAIGPGDEVVVIGLTFSLGTDKRNIRAREIQRDAKVP
ncbi:MAG: hypothetical protein JST16_13425 [Bdellovibrionales bacterium]|nr:hypothetical protein [Bdellovibrionales bacterium]